MSNYKTKVEAGVEKYLHRITMEVALGRRLLPTEVVHHKDGNGRNNRLENLQLCTRKEHRVIHAKMDTVRDGFDPETHAYCSMCKTYHPKEMFPKSKNRWNGVHNLCKSCVSQYKRDRGYNVNKFDDRAKVLQQLRRARKKGKL